ncbi:MAG TPA: sugar phosphate nucleotidyltransferase [Ignavibacteria bacterium]|nr:nucleotidyl transferase [Bacteroidota bacterium]HRI86278.1 sugar phosphate nucleotidyltransferase [Ignavibacteria bacterium]HRK00547.1 sugar phosphate nucleotidyltransferase [Ignavibacteria bacterium]
MKVIIPVAGFGTRLRPHTLTKPKVLLNVGGKPMIFYIIDQLIKDKIASSIILITGFLGEKIREYLDNAFDFKFDYIVQEEAKGLGHAVHCAKPVFKNKNEECLIILGDTLFDVDLKKLINSNDSVIGVKKVDDPRRFGVVEKNDNGFIKRFVEKPSSKEISPSNEAIVGLYYLKNSSVMFNSLEYIMKNKITVKGEFQLTDALENMISKKEKMTTYNVTGWLDCGKPETLLETNRYILQKRNKKIKSEYPDSKIIYPVHIGKNVEITDSIIGPFATINNNCRVSKSIISNSILDNDVTVENAIIEESIIGEGAAVKRETVKISLGNNSELKI